MGHLDKLVHLLTNETCNTCGKKYSGCKDKILSLFFQEIMNLKNSNLFMKILPSHIVFVLKWSSQHVMLYPCPMYISKLLDKETGGVCLFGCPEHKRTSNTSTREIQVEKSQELMQLNIVMRTP